MIGMGSTSGSIKPTLLDLRLVLGECSEAVRGTISIKASVLPVVLGSMLTGMTIGWGSAASSRSHDLMFLLHTSLLDWLYLPILSMTIQDGSWPGNHEPYSKLEKAHEQTCPLF